VCPECQAEDERVQRKEAGGAPTEAAAFSENPIPSGRGQPLDAASQSYFGAQLKHDFSDVRVHAGAGAATLAKAHGALAYTSGHDIVFGDGRYSPTTSAGKHLLAHELTHVVQQSRSGDTQSRAAPLPVASPGPSGDVQERDAERTADRIAADASAAGAAKSVAPGARPQDGQPSSPVTAPPSAGTAPAHAGPNPPFYWGHAAPRATPVAIARWGATLGDIAQYLYGTPDPTSDLAGINELDPTKPLSAGTVVLTTGQPLTDVAARSLASARFLPTTCGDPDLFIATKKVLDALLDIDFSTIVGWIDESLPFASLGVRRSNAGIVEIFRKWGEQKFTEFPWTYPDGGDYLDRLFLKLSNKTKILGGVFTDESTNYYSVLFNHFDPDDEIAAVRDRTSKVFRSDAGIKELSFSSMFWEDVKSGKVRDRIFAYGRGVAKGAYEAGKGTVHFVKTVVTDPKQAWEGIKKMPAAVKTLWEHRSELWDKFANASPEEQAEMIGKLFGQIEFGIGSAGAGAAAMQGLTKLAELPGFIGEAATALKTIIGLPSKVLGGAARAVKTVVFQGVRFAAEGAMWAARGLLRLAGKLLRGTWSVVRQTVGGVTRRLYYFYDEAAGVLREIEEGIARLYVKCWNPCDLDKLQFIKEVAEAPEEEGALIEEGVAAQKEPRVSSTEESPKGGDIPKPPRKPNLKRAAGLIHGADQYRGGQTILTAKLKLPNGEIEHVAVPNTSAGWRDVQEEVAAEQGFKTIDPSTPGSDMHAEENLQAYIDGIEKETGGKVQVMDWAISRGKGGTSVICTDATCRLLSSKWGPQTK
jgi:hypothetical protein